MRIIIELQEAPLAPGQPGVTIQTEPAISGIGERAAQATAVDAGRAPSAAGAVEEPTAAPAEAPGAATDAGQVPSVPSAPPSEPQVAAPGQGQAADAGPAPMVSGSP
jgi:hypothetical protein